MVFVTHRYRCQRCRMGYSSYREAEDCEIGHIVKDSVAEFSTAISDIFKPDKPKKGKRK